MLGVSADLSRDPHGTQSREERQTQGQRTGKLRLGTRGTALTALPNLEGGREHLRREGGLSFRLDHKFLHLGDRREREGWLTERADPEV